MEYFASSGLPAKQLGVFCLPATLLAAFRFLNVRCGHAFASGPCDERRRLAHTTPPFDRQTTRSVVPATPVAGAAP